MCCHSCMENKYWHPYDRVMKGARRLDAFSLKPGTQHDEVPLHEPCCGLPPIMSSATYEMGQNSLQWHWEWATLYLHEKNGEHACISAEMEEEREINGAPSHGWAHRGSGRAEGSRCIEAVNGDAARCHKMNGFSGMFAHYAMMACSLLHPCYRNGSSLLR